MSKTSNAVHASLLRSVRTMDAEQQFAELQRQYPVLAGFVDPESLTGHLSCRGGDLDKKDAVIGLLVRIIQGRGANAALASSLLWLGVWPSLAIIFGRRANLFPGAPNELVSEVADCFTSVVANLDFQAVRRVAATLVRNTEREVVRRQLRTWLEDSRRVYLPARTELETVDPGESEDPPPPSRFGLADTLQDEEAVAELRNQIAPITGEKDVDLVIDAAIRGLDQRQVGERLGLSPEATRKRVQRALGRLRTRLGRRKSIDSSRSKPSTASCR